LIIEYKVLDAPTIISERQCNELGFEGWLLTTIVFDRDVHQYYFYFVREVREHTDITAAGQDKPTSRSVRRKPKL
jgi:hypothetical protein